MSPKQTNTSPQFTVPPPSPLSLFSHNLYLQRRQRNPTTLLVASRALGSMLSQIRLQLTDSHLAGIDLGFGSRRLVRIVLDGTELGVVLVQLSDANVLGRHSKGEGTREFALDGIEVIALVLKLLAETNDLFLLGSNLLLLAVGSDLAFNGLQIFAVRVGERFLDSLNDIDAN